MRHKANRQMTDSMPRCDACLIHHLLSYLIYKCLMSHVSLRSAVLHFCFNTDTNFSIPLFLSFHPFHPPRPSFLFLIPISLPIVLVSSCLSCSSFSVQPLHVLHVSPRPNPRMILHHAAPPANLGRTSPNPTNPNPRLRGSVSRFSLQMPRRTMHCDFTTTSTTASKK